MATLATLTIINAFIIATIIDWLLSKKCTLCGHKTKHKDEQGLPKCKKCSGMHHGKLHNGMILGI